jgi:hypothetical protein
MPWFSTAWPPVVIVVSCVTRELQFNDGDLGYAKQKKITFSRLRLGTVIIDHCYIFVISQLAVT